MGRLHFAALTMLSAGSVVACAALLGIDDGVPRSDGGVPDGGTPVDASVDVQTAKDAQPDSAPTICDPTKPFGAPQPLTALNVVGVEDAHGRLTPDELTIFFSSLRTGGLGSYDLYSAARAKRSDPFGAPTNLGAVVNDKTGEVMPTVSGDGLTLYFTSDRAFGFHVWFSTRPSIASPFTAPQVANGLVAAAIDVDPYVAPDNASILMSSTRQNDAGLADLFSANAIDGGFSVPVAISGVNTAGHDDFSGAMTADKRLLYFASNRPGGKGGFEIYVATRASAADAFGIPTLVAELNTAGNEVPDWISPDRCRLYFSSTKVANSGDYDLYVAEKTP